jgi:hypothetical protein
VEPWDVERPSELTVSPASRAPEQGVIAGLAIAVVVVLVAGIVAALLHSSKSSALSAAGIGTAATNTTKERTAKFVERIVLTSEGKSETAEIDGAEDFATKASSLSVGPIVIRVINGVEYFRPPPGLLPAGKSWVAVRPADVGASSSAASIIGNGDPSSGLQILGVIVPGSPHVVGRDTVEGAKVTHYAVKLDLKSFSERLGRAAPQAAPFLSAGVEALEASNDLSALPADVWIDAQNHVRELDYALLIRRGPLTITEAADIRLSDFGAPVVVPTPPATAVVPFAQVRTIFRRLLPQTATGEG